MGLKISCTLHDVTFLALCDLFYILSLCNPFRFSSFPLSYFWWGVWYSGVLVFGWLAGLFFVCFFFFNFHKRLRTKLQDSVSAVWWQEILGCLEPWWRMVTVFHCFCRKSRLASHYNVVVQPRVQPTSSYSFPHSCCKPMHNLLSAAAPGSFILA